MPTDLAAPARPHQAVDLRTQLRTLWNVLDDQGAVVRRQDIDALPDDIVQALCYHEARRIRALIEGEAAGWHPTWATPPSPRNRGVARATPRRQGGEPRGTRATSAEPRGPAQASTRRNVNGLRRCNAGAHDQGKPDTANEGNH